MEKLIFLLVFAALTAVSCGRNPKEEKTGENVETEIPFEFPYTCPPVSMSDIQGRTDYLALHWWDRVDFNDPVFMEHPDVIEQELVNYIVVLFQATPAAAGQGLVQLIDKSRSDAKSFRFMLEKLEYFLWDPNSPVRNDELYIPVVEKILTYPQIDSLRRARYSRQYNMITKNRIGMPATDFRIRTADGATFRLYDVKGYFTLLFFSNPGCIACREVLEQILQSGVVRLMEEQEKDGMPLLKIVSVYPDEDLELWRKHLPDLPSRWTNGYNPDRKIESDKLYDLKAIPTLYLLDKDKNVLLKDADFSQIEMVFLQLAGPKQ